MAIFKVIFNYQLFDRGFTEVYFRQEASLAAAATFGTNLIPRLLAPRAAGCILRSARISDVAGNRNTLVRPVNQTAPGIGSLTPDVTQAAVILKQTASAIGASRQVWLRGIVDDLIQRNLNGTDSVGVQLDQMILFLDQAYRFNNFGIYALRKIGEAGVFYVNLRHIVGAANAGFVTLTTDQDVAAWASTRTIITQTNPKLYAGLDGEYTFTRVDATHIRVPYNVDVAVDEDLVVGRARPATRVFGAFDSPFSRTSFSKFGSRDTGRNPTAGRGRRPSRRLRSR